MDFIAFYKTATGYVPYPYQCRLAMEPWPDLIDIPTGLGKTGAVALAWLYRRYKGDESAPTRLVWCLPMRTLVEQTRDVIGEWLEALLPLFNDAGQQLPIVEQLMGGAQGTAWTEFPENPAVLVGTQDMLLSRVLMRGYGMSRYAWPMHYAWLNNDALWVFDETQLMGVGVETSAQLQAFRTALGTAKPTRTIWMSATLGQGQLETVDHPMPKMGWRVNRLGVEDFDLPAVRQRTSSQKFIVRSSLVLDKKSAQDLTKKSGKSAYAAAFADRVLEIHKKDTLTLVIVNRVSRAQAIYEALKARDIQADVALLHSRFRPADREQNYKVLKDAVDRIVVSTQVVEAGVDVSARTLFTELAPWPSLVQRFGRCNRYGEQESAHIEWVDQTFDEKDEAFILPYALQDINASRELLASLSDAGPNTLTKITYTPPDVVRPVIRHRDILELFDTTPDLSGNDLDVSRYVRDESDAANVSVFWRELEAPDVYTPAPHRDELCNVTLSSVRNFVKRKNVDAFAFDPLEADWYDIDEKNLRPGQTILITSKSGGYTSDIGFTGMPAKKGTSVPEIVVNEKLPRFEAIDDELESVTTWRTLAEHTEEVVGQMSLVAGKMACDDAWTARLALAAQWHDIGKAHQVFQQMLRAPGQDEEKYRAPSEESLWAKSNHNLGRSTRRGFRHELASALAFLQNYEGSAKDTNVIAYLIAAHHGRVRLSIRSLPNETGPSDPLSGGLFARGVWHGDILPSVELSDGAMIPQTCLDLSPMQLGENSWLERMLSLRDDVNIGPFRLAWYESLLRVADQRASARERKGGRNG